LKEANEGPKAALRFYEELLEADPSNAVRYYPLCTSFHFTEKAVAKLKAIWKRQISVLRKLGEIDRAVGELSKFVDTFYTDVEAWLELADIYTSQNQCASYSRQYRHSGILTPAQIYLSSAVSIPRLGVDTTKPVLRAPGWGNGIYSSGHPVGHEVLPHGHRDDWR